MTTSASFRGQPLVLIGTVLAGWVALRIVTWQLPFEVAPVDGLPLASLRIAAALQPDAAVVHPVRASDYSSAESLERVDGHLPGSVLFDASPAPWRTDPVPSASTAIPLPSIAAVTQPYVPMANARAAVGHNLLLLAGLSQMEVPSVLLPYLRGQVAPGVPRAAPALASLPARPVVGSASRWSGDGWLMIRDGSSIAQVPGMTGFGPS